MDEISKGTPVPQPLLTAHAFTRAEAIACDVPDVNLPRRGMHNVTRGVWASVAPTEWRDRALATALVLPESSAFSHVTAALAHDFSLPRSLAQRSDLDVVTPTKRAQRRRPGWIGHRGAELRTMVMVNDLPVTDAIDTWCDLASLAVGRRRALHLDDLIVIGDEVLNEVIRRELAGSNRSALGHAQRHLDPLVVDPALALIRARVTGRFKYRGKSVLLQALPLIRAGVKSPQETRTRLLFVRCGLPEPLVNANIHADNPDGPDGGGGGGWLAEGDLVWRESRTVAEYQSEHHAHRDRRSRDSSRLALLGDHDWEGHEVWSEDLRPGARQFALIQRVTASLARHGRAA